MSKMTCLKLGSLWWSFRSTDDLDAANSVKYKMHPEEKSRDYFHKRL